MSSVKQISPSGWATNPMDPRLKCFVPWNLCGMEADGFHVRCLENDVLDWNHILRSKSEGSEHGGS